MTMPVGLAVGLLAGSRFYALPNPEASCNVNCAAIPKCNLQCTFCAGQRNPKGRVMFCPGMFVATRTITQTQLKCQLGD